MKPVFIDTNAYSAIKRKDHSIVEIVQIVDEIAMSPVVIGELLFGFDGGSKAKQNRKELQDFLDSTRVKIYPITSDTSYFFSQICMSLKRKGKPIPTNDIWIASQCLEHGSIICTYDKHFEEIESLLIARSVADLAI
jgi:tRNA(fMet)-specific endonuclease VapC